MICVQDVLRLVREQYPADETSNSLCSAACLEIEKSLKEDADAGDIRVLNAAAALCHRKSVIRAAQQDDGVTSFRAGDVTVRISPSKMLENAEDSLREAMLAAAPLLRDDAFVFRRIG